MADFVGEEKGPKSPKSETFGGQKAPHDPFLRSQGYQGVGSTPLHGQKMGLDIPSLKPTKAMDSHSQFSHPLGGACLPPPPPKISLERPKVVGHQRLGKEACEIHFVEHKRLMPDTKKRTIMVTKRRRKGYFPKTKTPKVLDKNVSLGPVRASTGCTHRVPRGAI